MLLQVFLSRQGSQIFVMERRPLALGQSSSYAKHRAGFGSETPRLGHRLPAGPCLWSGTWVSQRPTLLAGKRVVAKAGLEEEPTSCWQPTSCCVQRVMAQTKQRGLVPMSKNLPPVGKHGG